MIYLITYKNIKGLPDMEMITRGFSCTPSELLQEIATRLHIKKQDILNVGKYDSREACQILIDCHYGKDV